MEKRIFSISCLQGQRWGCASGVVNVGRLFYVQAHPHLLREMLDDGHLMKMQEQNGSLRRQSSGETCINVLQVVGNKYLHNRWKNTLFVVSFEVLLLFYSIYSYSFNGYDNVSATNGLPRVNLRMWAMSRLDIFKFLSGSPQNFLSNHIMPVPNEQALLRLFG